MLALRSFRTVSCFLDLLEKSQNRTRFKGMTRTAVNNEMSGTAGAYMRRLFLEAFPLFAYCMSIQKMPSIAFVTSQSITLGLVLICFICAYKTCNQLSTPRSFKSVFHV